MAETATTEADPRIDPEEEESERWAHEEAPPPEVDYSRVKRWVMQRDGKDYIQFAGLLDLLHQESHGEFTITTKLEQAPTKENGMLAVVSAVATIGQHDRVASGIGDASPESVNRMMAPHLCRMAETRAKGRALRDLLNIPLVTIEELGPAGSAAGAGSPAANGRPQPQPEGIVVEGQRFTRPQIWEAYQRRMGQMKAANLEIPRGAALAQNAPLSQLVGVTQMLKKKLAEAGQIALPPA